MSKLPWNKFLTDYPPSASSDFTFIAQVSSQLPNPPQFDEKGKKLPSPYGLFQEWLKATLAGDWAAMSIKGGFAVKVATQADADAILASWRQLGSSKATPFSSQTILIDYQDSSYGALAEARGYAIKRI